MSGRSTTMTKGATLLLAVLLPVLLTTAACGDGGSTSRSGDIRQSQTRHGES